MSNNLFRFVVSRPPQRVEFDDLATRVVHTHPPGAPETDLLRDLLERRAAGDRAGMRLRARRFLESPEYVADLDSLQTPLAPIDRLIVRRGNAPGLEQVTDLAKEVFGTNVAGAAAEDGYSADRRRVGDSLLALHIAADPERSLAPHLTRAMRILGLLDRIAEGEEGMGVPGAIRTALQATIVLPGSLYPLPAADSTLAARSAEAHRDRLERLEGVRTRGRETLEKLKDLSSAIEEMAAAYDLERRALDAEQGRREAPGGRRGPPERESSDDAEEVHVLPSGPVSRGALSEESLRMLSKRTRELLDQSGFQADEVEVVAAVTALEAQAATAARSLYAAEAPAGVVLMGTRFIPVRDVVVSGDLVVLDPNLGAILPGKCAAPDPESPESSGEAIPYGPGSVQVVGVGDLMVVEQELQRYQLGEVAHIENVLQGETKERTHRRAVTTEETLFLESEVTEELERDLATTERFELQTETQNVIKQDTSREAGLTVSGRYGTVKFTADARYASNTAREESRRAASSYSRDVTDRAVSRIQERVLERRTRRRVEEVEEKNLHRLDNTGGSANIAGIYRWVDKLYKAQVVNYGRRAMFEFIVPQPAAFLKHAMAAKPLEGLTLERPDAPGYCHPGTSTFVPLRPQDLTPFNYLFWVAKYNAEGVDPPPPQFKIKAAAFSEENLPTGSQDVVARSDNTLEIPDGYLAHRAWLRGTRAGLGSPVVFLVYLGRNEVSNFNFIYGLDDEDETVPLAVLVSRVPAYGFTLEIECQRGPALLEKWQLATYSAIMTAYRNLEAQYEEQLAAQQIQQTVPMIQGRNPEINRRTEQNELKRAVISVLTAQHFDVFDSMRKNVPVHGYPQVDLAKVADEGPFIRFFEQAFEWENMVYLFYPYFWGRKEDWPANLLLDDADPLFADFLRAGAARVVVPARPGFEAAVASYLDHGWPIVDEADPGVGDASDGPAPGALPLLSVVDEIKGQQGYRAVTGEGTLAVTQGAAKVSGTGTAFDEEDDMDREIHIGGVKYRIRQVTSPTEVELTTGYAGSSASGLRYALGVRYLGEPWEVRVPTSLVMLQKDSELPSFE